MNVIDGLDQRPQDSPLAHSTACTSSPLDKPVRHVTNLLEFGRNARGINFEKVLIKM